MTYDAEYYQSLNYSDYLTRGHRYEQLAKEVVRLLEDTNLMPKRMQRILDFGCAVGFLVRGLQYAGYGNAYGYDVSEWAIDYGINRLGISGLKRDLNADCYSLAFALDVFEHMPLPEVLNRVRQSANMWVVRIPVADESGEFILPTARRNPTHCTALTKGEWLKAFKDIGYDLVFTLNLGQIFDSPGVLSAVIRRRH